MFKFTALPVALAVSCIPAFAGELKFDVPFAFRAGPVTLPAGAYTFNHESRSGLILIAGRGGSAMLMSHPGSLVDPGAGPALEFNKDGSVAVLKEVRLGGDSSNLLPAKH